MLVYRISISLQIEAAVVGFSGEENNIFSWLDTNSDGFVTFEEAFAIYETVIEDGQVVQTIYRYIYYTCKTSIITQLSRAPPQGRRLLLGLCAAAIQKRYIYYTSEAFTIYEAIIENLLPYRYVGILHVSFLWILFLKGSTVDIL